LIILCKWNNLYRFERNLRLEVEEQRKCLSCSHKEDTSANDHHDLLLGNLLIDCNVLIFSISKIDKSAKETNWKQKFQKLQNENICLTNLNAENNGNFNFLSFDGAVMTQTRSS